MNGRVATGDLGYQDERGLTYITGRRSRFAKIFGWRVALDDVEEMLAPHAAVATVENEGRILIFAEADPSRLDSPVDALARTLRLHRSAFEVRRMREIPRLPNGKTDYRRVLEVEAT